VTGPDDITAAWTRLAELTPARIALGRTGSGLPTREVLGFAMAHARARDAVHTALDTDAVTGELEGLGLDVARVASAATSREVYLRRPDLGRRLDEASAAAVDALGPKDADLAIVVGDGLSATAVHRNAAAVVDTLRHRLQRQGRSLAPVVVATGARVALGDDVGERLRVRAVLVLIGERPGLSAPDSLGAYLTFAPALGRNDAERNCVSNIRDGGLAPAAAALRLAWLVDAALTRGLSGVHLKDESEPALAHGGDGRGALVE
jgi:ethanolamine ammonia-lyase small subunit